VIGAGAAGLMCAIEAGKRGRRVVVLEHNAQVGRKILISGGGRCNFTNLDARPENFLSSNPHFAKSALARFGPQDFLALVGRHGIAYHEKTAGQLFCDQSAREIVALLEAECGTAGVRIETGRAVRSVKKAGAFEVVDDCDSWRAESLVIATGGLSIPKIGATPFGYSMAAEFGLRVVACRPALVPLTFGREDRAKFESLAGLSAEVIARADGREFREKMLFTHRGLSGPAVLQASSYWKPGEALEIDLLPGVDLASVMQQRRAAGDRSQVRTLLGQWLPKRLADRWFEVQGESKPVAALSDREMERIAGALRCWRVTPAGTEGYEKAEVTAGGVATVELSSQTMEARKVPGLYFIGEVVDVTGQLGGFNFQWAWASGFAAGQYA
jgi:predicted Rossmann fold flavoprotein